MKIHIEQWDVENEAFWESTGKKIAYRNLWISISCLICAFAVWLNWSIITVQMKNLGFPFDTVQLFTLSAIAGLAGATFRIPNSFLIGISGGRNVIALTTGLLIIPALGVGIALQDINTPYMVFAIMAALSGLGGGNFASSMSNINFFFPKKVQGMSLGLNAGLGNIGVSVMQVLVPFATTFAIFGTLGGSGLPLVTDVGNDPAGKIIFIQNSGLVWVPLLIILTLAAWFGMNNLAVATPKIGSTLSSLGKSFGLIMVGLFGTVLGLALLLGLGWSMWIVLPVTIVATVLMMKAIPGDIKENLNSQFAIFKNKHNWVMTYLYVMTFGSFIGYSAAFPLLIRVVFGELADGTMNPNAPNPFAYAWLGPLVGSVARPIGGWVSDKFGGARITHWDTIVMILATLGVSFYVKQAQSAAQPEQFFVPFLILFLILFVATGIGNGSTFRMVPTIFEPAEAGPVLGWISAVAAYGAFIVPRVIGQQVEAGTSEYALYGFAIYYFTCLILNWYFYVGKNAETIG